MKLEPAERSRREDALDEACDRADQLLYERLHTFLREFEPPDLDWHFSSMNNHKGTLLFWSSLNHRGVRPAALRVLDWLAEAGPGSYGVVYLHDDEDHGKWAVERGRPPGDRSNDFRVWRLKLGVVSEHDDPFLSPIDPDLAPESSR